MSEICGNRHREERHARFINDRVHANIQRDGTFSVVPRIRGGVTTPDELRRIADVAERHEVPLVKITGGQRIDLLGVRKEQLPAIWEELGMPSGHAYAKAVRTVKTCVGTDFCRFGLGDAIGVGIELERAMEGLYTPHKVKSAVTGCPRNCAEAYVKDIGLVAVEGGWELYVGGAAGSTVRKGDLLASVATSDEAIRLALAFLQHYREQAEYLERTYTYVERVGHRRRPRGRARRHRRHCSSATGSPRRPPTPTRGASATTPSTRSSSRSSTHDGDRRHLDARRPRRGHPAARRPQHQRRRPPDRDLPAAERTGPRSTRTARTPPDRSPTGSSPTRA